MRTEARLRLVYFCQNMLEHAGDRSRASGAVSGSQRRPVHCGESDRARREGRDAPRLGGNHLRSEGIDPEKLPG